MPCFSVFSGAVHASSGLTRRALGVLWVLGAFGCLTVEPPVGHFVCADDGECPDEWVCGDDARCYAEPLACYASTQTGCPAGQACYVGTSLGPVCFPPGSAREGATCAGSIINECEPGSTCVRDRDGERRCCRYCQEHRDCPIGMLCTGDLVEQEGYAQTGTITVCERP